MVCIWDRKQSCQAGLETAAGDPSPTGEPQGPQDRRCPSWEEDRALSGYCELCPGPTPAANQRRPEGESGAWKPADAHPSLSSRGLQCMHSSRGAHY